MFPLPDGRWAAQVPYYVEGKRKFLTRIRRTEKLAEQAIPGLLARVDADHELVDTAQTLDRFLADWLVRVEASVKSSTLVSYCGHVNRHIGPLLGGIPVEDLRASDVDRLVRDRRKAGKSAATITRIMTTLSMALEQAVREGTLPRNVARLARRPRVDRHEAAIIGDTEAERLLEAISGDPLEPFYALLLGSGLRRGEAVALDWRDVDLDAATVTVRTGKTARAVRTVSMAPFAVAALRAHRAASPVVGPAEPVFRGAKGERLRGDVAYHQWLRLLARAGLGHLRLHDLRHGHATLLLAGGTPIRLIADQLGHASPSTTENVYAHVIEAQLHDAVQGLGRLSTKRLTSSGRS